MSDGEPQDEQVAVRRRKEISLSYIIVFVKRCGCSWAKPVRGHTFVYVYERTKELFVGALVVIELAASLDDQDAGDAEEEEGER